MIESIHKDHYVRCQCGNVGISGGISHLAVYHDGPHSFLDLSIVELITEFEPD